MPHLQRDMDTPRRPEIERLDIIRDEFATLAAEYKAEGDSLRRLPMPLAEAFVRHDVYRLLLPHDLAGSAVDPLDYLQLVEDIARVDGSTAWCLAIGIGSGLYAGYLPPERSRTMFAEPDCCIAGAYAPIGRGVTVPGGYRVSGHWGWASGVHQARWMVFGFTVGEGGRMAARLSRLARHSESSTAGT